jgi:hypothetical protein
VSNIPPVISDRIGPLVEPLHEAFELARHRIDHDYRGLHREDQVWLRTHALRGLLWQHLSDSGLPEHWSLTGNHRQNGSIHLAYGSGQMVLRAVHAFPSGEAPIAGSNGARRAFYTNQALADLADPDHMPPQRMLLVWEEWARDSDFLLTVVHPLTPGSPRNGVRSDLEFGLPRTQTAFEQMQFDTADDDEDLLFEFDVDDLGDETGTDYGS